VAALKNRIRDLERRVLELETLCAEVYVAGVELGLPSALITRLWTIAAEGNLPVAFRPDPSPEPLRIAATRDPANAALPLPDLRRVDRALADPAVQTETNKRAAHLKPMPRRRALIVDDDPLMLDVLVRILRRENLDLLTAQSGPDALTKAEGQTIDLLITDFHMPDMKGPELADRLRQRLPDLKVLYQTGFADQLFESRVELGDGEAFLEKPFSAVGLREAARLVLFGRINP
jgi:CheY-like chemotaxis protein